MHVIGAGWFYTPVFFLNIARNLYNSTAGSLGGKDLIVHSCLLRLCDQTSPPLLPTPWSPWLAPGTSRCGPASTAAPGTGGTWAEVRQLQGHSCRLTIHHCRLQLLPHGLRLPRLRPLLQHPRILQEGRQPGQEAGQGGRLQQGDVTASRGCIKS